jgi:tetratricopeptide (TPR) repeat protein
MAACGPIALIGLGLMLYNALRFGNPLEFGVRHTLAGDRQSTVQHFSLRYLWLNFRVYFLEPGRWNGRFPFVHDITVPPLPAGHGRVEHAFGVLTNNPLVWLALAVPLAWRRRSAPARSRLCEFLAAVAVLFGTGALTLGLYYYAAVRYEVEFLPALMLLAVIGILSLERALVPTSERGQTCQPGWRPVARWGWGLLLGFSVAFNLLASIEHCAEAHYNLANVLLQLDRNPEAIAHFEQALRLKPDYAEAHSNLAIRLKNQGRLTEAIEHYEQALRIEPHFAEARNNLGVALGEAGRVQEEIACYEEALRMKPDYAEAHFNLAHTLAHAGELKEAVTHYEQALRINPDYTEAHNNLGNALFQQGRMTEAITQYEQALRIKPDYAEAHNNLANVLFRQGRVTEAIAQYEEALRLKPDSAGVHYNLGVALEQAGRLPEALDHYGQAVKLRPGFVEAEHKLARLRAVE